MVPFTFKPLTKEQTRSIWVQLDAKANPRLIEEAMTYQEIASTMPDYSVGSRWIANNPDRFLEAYPDVVAFLRTHQQNPSTAHILEHHEVARVIGKVDLIDTYRRIILRHLPISHAWFQRLHETVVDDTQSVYLVFLEWFELRMRSEGGKSFMRSFFCRWWAGELERKNFSLSPRDPAAHRLRGGAIWQLLSTSCFVATVEKIIQAGHIDTVCEHWMMIRVHLLDHVEALEKIEALLCDATRETIRSVDQYVILRSLEPQQRIDVLDRLRPPKADLRVAKYGNVADLPESFDLEFLLDRILADDLETMKIGSHLHILEAAHPIVAYSLVAQYRHAASGQRAEIWSGLAEKTTAALSRSVPAYTVATAHWDSVRNTYYARAGATTYIHGHQYATVGIREGGRVFVPVLEPTTIEVEVKLVPTF